MAGRKGSRVKPAELPEDMVNERKGCKYTKEEVELFAEVYVRTMNPERAYRECRFMNAGKSDAVVHHEAYRLLKDSRFNDAIERIAKRSGMSKARLNILLSDEIEAASKECRLGEAVKLIDVLCKMNGYYEATKIDVRHGALDEENKMRALEALRSAGVEVEDADYRMEGEKGGSVPLLQ